MSAQTPTSTEYSSLDLAYDHFNARLFAGRLPPALITVTRAVKNAHGYFWGKRFAARANGAERLDEIGLNPDTMDRPVADVLSTLVHEMVHLWQLHHGKPSRNSYHNAEFAREMERVGLMPSATGAPGGKRTGQQMSHYVLPGGPFALAAAELLATGYALHWHSGDVPVAVDDDEEGQDEQEGQDDSDEQEGKEKSRSKVKYTCPACRLNVWGKPGLLLLCGNCTVATQAPVILLDPSST